MSISFIIFFRRRKDFFQYIFKRVNNYLLIQFLFQLDLTTYSALLYSSPAVICISSVFYSVLHGHWANDVLFAIVLNLLLCYY